MERITKLLLERQRDGKKTSVANLAHIMSLGPKDVIQELAQAMKLGEMHVRFYPELAPSSLLFGIPSPEITRQLGCYIEELLWPELTNDLLTGNFAARIYIYNWSVRLYGSDKYPHNRAWADNLEYLYRNLALTAFGPSEGWTEDQGLMSEFPVEDTVIQALPMKGRKPVPGQRIGMALRCRMCGKGLRNLETSFRGIGVECLQILSSATGIPRSELESAQYITDDRLDELIMSMKDNPRPQHTESSAKEAYPEGYISVGELVAIARSKGISVARVVRAIGGDRGLEPTHSENWNQFLIDRKRYVSRKALAELEEVRYRTKE